MRVSLTHYSGPGEQPVHSHDFTQCSFLLAGRMVETLEGREFCVEGQATGYKPAGSLHSDRWGPEGALVFSITFGKLATPVGKAREPGWRGLGRNLPLGEIVAACFQPDEGRRREAVHETLAIAWEAPGAAAKAPRWLRKAREALAEQAELSVAEVANRVGVDRSHLTRAFQRCYGMPPSVFRRGILTARAVAAVAQTDDRLARVAHHAGFSDHAHMTRTLRSDTGLMPGRLRSLLKDEITSIQDLFHGLG